MEFHFNMNNRNWIIKELPQSNIRELVKQYDGEIEAGQYFGLTLPKYQTVFIDMDLCNGQKEQTLLHELMHCYISSYLFDCEFFDEEALCDISACSHDIIHKIAEEYFKCNSGKSVE